MTRAAGCAYPKRNLIRLNPRLLTDESRIEDTLAHEYAHLLAYERHGAGIRPHGPEWRAVLRSMGYDPKRCHDYPEAQTLGARLVYACERCGFAFRRRRRLPTRRTYVHAKCGGRIVLSRCDPS